MTLTKHAQRADTLRRKMRSVIRHLVVPSGRRGGLTQYGVFAEKAQEIAKDRGLKYLKDDGTSAHAVRRFCDGRKPSAYESTMDVWDLTCEFYKTQQKIDANMQKLHEFPETGHLHPTEEQQQRFDEIDREHGLTQDRPEILFVSRETEVIHIDSPASDIRAFLSVAEILDPLQDPDRARVLRYIEIRYMP